MGENLTSVLTCNCKESAHPLKLIVLTGGPGAGKTAILEIAKKHFCQHVSILPEAASIIFGGGFWRHNTDIGKMAAQRAIFHVQREMERLAQEEALSAIALCDRGTLDGLAYWPSDEKQFWHDLETDRQTELARYAAVIHLRTPIVEGWYNHQNPLRTETALQAAEIDKKIESAWNGHPRRFIVESVEDFLAKASRALDLIRHELPECCK